MAIEQRPHQPPALISKISLTPQELEERLRSVYRIGVAEGIRKASAGQVHNQPVMPTCPRHCGVPLWLEAHGPSANGNWLYCPFCRQDAQAAVRPRQTEGLRKIHLQKALECKEKV